MYLDYVLFGFGAILLLTFAVTTVFIIRNWSRWKDDEKAVSEAKTERLEIYETMSQTLSSNSEDVAASFRNATLHITEKIGDWKVGAAGDVLNISPLSGKYRLLKEIHGGNMSRVFLAEDTRLKNECVVKFIATSDPRLADEAVILKQLNHVGLPQVLDLIPTQQGLFLVERCVEGYSLNETLLLMKDKITCSQICDWGVQLAQILSYLHGLNTPIFHCDIKPSNIMVTHDNRLVLVDFGIAQRGGTVEKINYVTFGYAAPELLAGSKMGQEYIHRRFGNLPNDAGRWSVDDRTDIYSVGVILYEMLTGRLPEKDTVSDIYHYAERNLGSIIYKCLQPEPMNRYRNAKELADALEAVKNHWSGAPHRLWLRKVAIFVCSIALAGSMGTTASAAYIHRIENSSKMFVNPAYITVSPHESMILKAETLYPGGGIQDIDLDRISWTYSEKNIAALEGSRLMGLQTGTVTLTGKYRNQNAVIEVEVTEPVEDGVQVSLQYVDGVSVSRFAGGSARDQVDGTLSTSLFVAPASLDMDEDTLYLTDSGTIRMIRQGMVSSITNVPSYIRAEVIRHRNGRLYFVTGDWEEDDGSYHYGIAEYANNSDTVILYETESGFTSIPDFAISSDGTVWFILDNYLEGITRLQTMDLNGNVAFALEIPEGSAGLSFDENDNLYISVPNEGMIYRLEKDSSDLIPFVGGKGERNFIDGISANFYRPTSMVWDNHMMYVLDFDTIRRVRFKDDNVVTVETIAGVPIPETNPEIHLDSGNKTYFASDNTASLVVSGENWLLLSDAKNSTIYQVTIDDTVANTQNNSSV